MHRKLFNKALTLTSTAAFVLPVAGCGSGSAPHTATSAGSPTSAVVRTSSQHTAPQVSLNPAPSANHHASTRRAVAPRGTVRISRRIRRPALLELPTPGADAAAWIRTDKPLSVNGPVVPYYLAILDRNGKQIAEGSITRQHHYQDEPPCFDIDFPEPNDLDHVHVSQHVRAALYSVNHHSGPAIRISPTVPVTARATPTSPASQLLRLKNWRTATGCP
jgi:hypothetical protein